MVIVSPLIFLRGAPEKVKGRMREAAGGMLFLEVDDADMFHRMVPYALMLWEPGRRSSISKSSQLWVVV